MTAPAPRSQPDIVERLRGFRIWSVRHGHYNPVSVCQEGADQIAALQARVEELTKALEWWPIGTAPKDGTRIIGFSGNGSRVVSEIFYMPRQPYGATGTHSHPGGWIGPNGHLFDATDWQPLPRGPAVSLEDRK